MAAGRLDAGEFDERLTRALNAKVGPDLDTLFTDLPIRGPARRWCRPNRSRRHRGSLSRRRPLAPQLATPTSAKPPSSVHRNFAIVTATAWTLAILFCFANGWQNWWILFIPIFLSWGMKRRP